MKHLDSRAGLRHVAVGVAGALLAVLASPTRADALSEDQLYGSSLPVKTLEITFDDGPGGQLNAYPSTAGEISRWLNTQGIRATFFENGGRIVETSLPNPWGLGPTPDAASILAQIVADGHLVGNHTTTHRDLVTQVLPLGAAQLEQELAETDTDLAGLFPSGHYLLRTPYCDWSDDVWNALVGTAMNKYVGPIEADVGGDSSDYPETASDWACWQGQVYTVASGGTELTTVNPDYPGYLTTDQCCQAYLTSIEAMTTGGIVLMHDPYFWDQGNTVDMVETCLVPTLQAMGYSFVRVDEIPAVAEALPGCDPSCNTCIGTGPTDCTTCFNQAYLSGGTCTDCTTCPATSYASTACTATSDTVCTPCSTCATGQYAATACGATADTVCHACSTCPDTSYVATACSATADTACAACDATCATCTGAGADHCATCPMGAYLAGGTCTPCGSCPPGEGPTSSCTPTSPPACAACAAGTFSSDGSTCAACPTGTFSSAAGSAACVACGSCDDADACTADTCDPTSGCVHSAIPGCVPDGGAGDGGSAHDAATADSSPARDAGRPPAVDAGTAPLEASVDAGVTSTSAGTAGDSGRRDATTPAVDAGRASSAPPPAAIARVDAAHPVGPPGADGGITGEGTTGLSCSSGRGSGGCWPDAVAFGVLAAWFVRRRRAS